MNIYLGLMGAGGVIIFTLYGLFCAVRGKGKPLGKRAGGTAALSLLFSAVLAPVLGRIGYALMTEELDFEEGLEGLEVLLEIGIDRFSFFWAAAGVVLGVLLANRLMRREALWQGMDAFAPFGALLTALFRAGEISVPYYGGGAFLPEGHPLAFFPFALKIETAGGYTEHVWAVCGASALCALVCAGVAFRMLKRGARTGAAFSVTLFCLCIPQIVCESWRSEGIFWLFVHAEQVLCAVTALGTALYWMIRTRGLTPARRWAPAGVMVICAGLVIAAEFAIDGKLFDLPPAACYVFMIAVTAVMGAAGLLAARHWMNGEKTMGGSRR